MSLDALWNGYELFYLRAIYYAFKKKEKKKAMPLRKRYVILKRIRLLGNLRRLHPAKGIKAAW